MRFARPPWPRWWPRQHPPSVRQPAVTIKIGRGHPGCANRHPHGQTSPFANVALGVQSNVRNQGLIGRKSGQAFPAKTHRRRQHAKRLFSGASAGSSGGTDPNAQVKSVLELNQQALSSLKTKLGSLEKSAWTLTPQLSRISSRLSSSEQPSGACGTVNYNPSGYPTDGGTANAFRGQAELQAEILVQAMACGLTKVAGVCNWPTTKLPGWATTPTLKRPPPILSRGR